MGKEFNAFVGISRENIKWSLIEAAAFSAGVCLSFLLDIKPLGFGLVFPLLMTAVAAYLIKTGVPITGFATGLLITPYLTIEYAISAWVLVLLLVAIFPVKLDRRYFFTLYVVYFCVYQAINWLVLTGL